MRRRLATFLAGAPLIAESRRRRPARSASTAQRCSASRDARSIGGRRRRCRAHFFESHLRAAPHRGAAASSPAISSRRSRQAASDRARIRRPALSPARRSGRGLADRSGRAGWDPEMRFARAHAKAASSPISTARRSKTGALAGRGLELAWLRDPVDAFFIHVQGSARLRLADGTTLRIAFDGKSGHAYTSIGRLAVERGILTRDARGQGRAGSLAEEHTGGGQGADAREPVLHLLPRDRAGRRRRAARRRRRSADRRAQPCRRPHAAHLPHADLGRCARRSTISTSPAGRSAGS